MTKDTWDALQRELTKYTHNISAAAERELKKLLETHAAKAVREYDFDAAAYAKRMEEIINKAAALPAQKAQAIADRAMEEAMIKVGVKGEAERVLMQKRLYEAHVIQATQAVYTQTHSGSIVRVPENAALPFVSKYELSGVNRPKYVWQIGDLCEKIAYEKQEQIQGIVRAGIADGLDVNTIGRDLQAHIRGEKVLGRWGMLKPDKEFEALRQEYIAKGYPSHMARQEALDDFKEQGKVFAEGSEEYYARFGPDGIDYRAARLMRTEQANALSERQAQIARSNLGCTGQVEIVLERARDSWHCSCQANAEASKGGKYLGYDNYLYEDKEFSNPTLNVDGEHVGIPPYHPNCFCELRPIMKNNDDFMQDVFAAMDAA